MKLAAVVLAAGAGIRMKSNLSKVLHRVCGKPMLGHVLDTVVSLKPVKTLVVAGYKIEKVREYLAGTKNEIVHQKKLLGSGHAVLQCASKLKGFKGNVFVLYGDAPLIRLETLKRLLDAHRESGAVCTLLSIELNQPFGYGRICRGYDGNVEKIIEENDAMPDQKKIKEINVGCYVFDSKKLFDVLKRVPRNAKKNEYYLTDAVEMLLAQGRVEAVLADDVEEVLGVNSRLDLAVAQENLQKRILAGWIERGVWIRDPKTTIIDAGVKIGENTEIFPNTVIEDTCQIGAHCQIGPFARLRGGSRISDGAVIGNFVEVVRSSVGPKTQIKHLSYIGDAQIGSGVNVGAGTITANYDGRSKHKTTIKDLAQIGSGTILVAPITVGRAAKTGAGSVLLKGKNVPDNAVVVGIPARKIGK